MSEPTPVAAVPFDGKVANLDRTWSIDIATRAPGPPRRIDGYSIGVITVEVGPGPHDGEMHPDGDEFLHVVDGAMELLVDDGDRDAIGTVTTIRLPAGTACVVPRGTWHRVVAVEPSTLLHITPGPHGPARLRNRPTS